MRNPPKKTRKSEDFSNFKPQEIPKSPCSPQSTTPKFLTNEKRKENIFEEYRKKEMEATRNFDTFKPVVQGMENFRKPIEKMSPVTNLLKEGKFANAVEKGSEVKKLELNQQKQLKDFFKIKEKFGVNSVSPKREWNYLNNSKALIKNNDENVFYQQPMEKVVGDIQRARLSNILLWGVIFFAFLYMGLFVYHFLRADPIVFCNSRIEKDCIQCPYHDNISKKGRCLNGLLVLSVLGVLFFKWFIYNRCAMMGLQERGKNVLKNTICWILLKIMLKYLFSH